MLKKVIIYLFVLPIFIIGIITTMFVYSEQTQSLVINWFNFETVLNKKVKSFISKKINDENFTIEIGSIKVLKPNWPNIVKIELNDINVYTINQKEKSNINLIQLGFSYKNLLRNIFLNKGNLEFNYLNLKDLTLNAKLEKNKFTPGPLVKIFSLIYQKGFSKQDSFKNILQNKIIIGNINFLLSDQRIAFKENILKINCTNVFISKYLNKNRSLIMNCNKNKRLKFSIKVDLFEGFNNISGNIQNINPRLFFSNWVQDNTKFNIRNFSTRLNGNFNIITDKNFDLESLNFISEKSNLTISNNDNIIHETEFTGKMLWSKNTNILRFNDFLIGNIFTKYSEINFKKKTGFSKLQIKKLSSAVIKNNWISLNYNNSFNNLKFLKKYYNNFESGIFKNINLNLKFSFFDEINIEEIKGKSDFSNIRFKYNDKIFKKLFCRISGNFQFDLHTNNNETLNNQSWVKINTNASEGFVSLRKKNLEYKFNNAKIIGKIYKDHYIISKANFYSNNNLEYSFNNIEINQNSLKISEAISFRNNKIQYVFQDTKINDLIITNSRLIVKNSSQFSDYLKKNFNLEIIGEVDFNFVLSGNIKNLDLKLKLNSNLTNAAFKINNLNLIKKKNILSSIKSDIFYQKGKLAFLKNTTLKIEQNNYETSLIRLSNKPFKKIILEKVKTPNSNLNQISISRKDKQIDVYVQGKKINFSNLKNNLHYEIDHNKNINFDITADKIILDPKISLGGNLKGIIKKSVFDATAFGRMWLGKSSLLDSGKFKIYLDDETSKLSGVGLIGGAETKIIMKKNKNKFPQISFDTSDGGKLLKALGFTKNIRSGKMKVNINFLSENYDHYKGTITSKNFSLINTPGIINSLSILSFAGIQSVVSGEGVNFDKGQAKIKVKKHFFNFDKVYLSSQSLGISAKGKINLKTKYLDMRGSVAPIKLISQIISVVPAVGKLITGLKKEGLFAGQFKMVGPIKNPKTELNTLSFAPGILRDLFAEDWLNNDNFFLND